MKSVPPLLIVQTNHAAWVGSSVCASVYCGHQCEEICHAPRSDCICWVWVEFHASAGPSTPITSLAGRYPYSGCQLRACDQSDDSAIPMDTTASSWSSVWKPASYAACSI